VKAGGISRGGREGNKRLERNNEYLLILRDFAAKVTSCHRCCREGPDGKEVLKKKGVRERTAHCTYAVHRLGVSIYLFCCRWQEN